MPWTAATFTVAAFSMIGIPPTGGFFSKLYLLIGAVDAEQWVFVGLILFSSTLALVYLGNVIRYMYFQKDEAGSESVEGIGLAEHVKNEAPLTMLAPMLALAAGIMLLGIFNGRVVSGFLEHAIPASFGK